MTVLPTVNARRSEVNSIRLLSQPRRSFLSFGDESFQIFLKISHFFIPFFQFENDFSTSFLHPFIIQKQLQHCSCVHRIGFPFVPILFFWNLGIQHGAILSDVFALFAADFFLDFRIPSAFGIVKDIKVNAVSLALGFCQKSVFLFRAGANSNIMLRYTPKHIFALAYVYNLPIQLDAVNTWVFILGC